MSDDGEGRPPCSAPECRQFDFWVGEWEVRDPDGRLMGRNRITRLFDDCGLREEWRGESGLRGTSLNAWSPERGAWHQTWVDSAGTLLLLDGGLVGATMVLAGEASLPDEPGRVLSHRISWSLMDGDPDRLRQHWESSVDGGAWETAFDGRYTRSPA